MKKVAAMLAEGFEEVEALAVIDLLRRANVEITMVSVMNFEKVTGSHNITVMCDDKIDDIDIESFDMIFLPGGMPGTNNLDMSEKLCDYIKEFHSKGKLLAAICAAPKVFGRLGILKDKKATCFPGFEKDLIGAILVSDKVVKDGNVITSKGMGTAIDLGLELIKVLVGSEEANEMAKTIQYI